MTPLPQLTDPAAPPPTWRVPLDLLDANPFQPRREMEESPLSELVASIREHGLLQPITVRRVPGGRFQLIAGHRRLEAFRRLRAGGDSERYSTIPAHEKFDVTDEEMALLALVENLQRDDLSPLDAALGLARFQEAHRLSTEALCQRTGLEVDRAKRLLRLARTPQVIQQACHEGILVEQVNEHGQAKLLASGKPRQERVRLDLMAALEFAKLYAHVARSTPRKAEERTARAIQRALSERWSFRRVHVFCRGAVANAGAEAPTADAPASTEETPLFTDGPELRIRRSVLPTASPEQRQALVGVLIALVEELTT